VYPNYKHSGVDWLEDVPAHWDVKRTKFVALLRSGHTPSRQHPEYWQDCTIPWFGLADVWQIRDGKVEFVYQTSEKISELGLANSAARLLPKGTVILSRTASVGFAAILGVDMATTQDFVNWVCGPSIRPEYLLYVFRSMHQEFKRLTMGSTHQTIYMPDVERFAMPVPPLPEQDRIVDAVRRETSRIDALVAKKERLIELLQEKRSALITHAVTKGLDPTVPTKDSGVEWLGEIPAHWAVSQLKHAASHVIDCPHETPMYADDGDHLVVRTSDVADGVLDFSRARRIDDAEFEKRVRRLRVNPRDIVYSREGERFGHAALVPEGVSVCLGQRMMQFRIRSDWCPRFAMWQLNAKSVYQQALLDTAGATSPHVNVETIRSYWLCAPPPSEQRDIAEFLDREATKIDALVSRIHDAITRLKELRTALISAAVTGKIDVREEVA